MNLTNLQHLINYLESLPSDYEKFSMTDWYRVNVPSSKILSVCLGVEEAVAKKTISTECDTSMCIAGHMVLVPEFQEIIAELILYDGINLRWPEIVEEVLEISYSTFECRFIFDYSWADYDNTLDGAIARLKYCRNFPDKINQIAQSRDVEPFFKLKFIQQSWVNKTGPFER